MTSKPNPHPRFVSWLALSLSLGYLALMSTLMWLFERAITLDQFGQLFDSPHQIRSWAVIALTALGIFLLSKWALGRMSSPVAEAGSRLDAAGVGLPPDVPKPWRAAAVFLTMLAAILTGTSAFIISEQERSMDAARFQQFALIGSTKARSVARWVDERQRDLLVLLDNSNFVDELQRWAVQRQQGDAAHEALLADVSAVLAANGFDGLVAVDPQGRPMLNVPDDLAARAQCRLAAMDAQVGSEQLQPRLSFAFGGEAMQPKVDVIGSLFKQRGQSGDKQRFGTLCMRVDLGQRLLPLVSQWPGMARSGEVLLGRVDGEDIIWLNSRPTPGSPWRMQRLVGMKSQWEAAARATAAGQLRSQAGAAGQPQVMSVYTVQGTPWRLLVRMDTLESDQLQLRHQMRGTVAIGFMMIFIIAAFAVAWARSSYSSSSFHAQRDALLAQLREMAYYDELTGLPGRRLIQDRLSVALHDAERRGEKVALMFIDLDRFKAINDRHGHAAGDAVLRAVAERLLACLRKNDSAGRLAGDEFLVVLPGGGESQDLAILRDRVRTALGQDLNWQGQTLAVGVSIGTAVFPDDATDAAGLMAHADAAMYSSKRAAG